MKKVLALVLAVMMMATVAFGATIKLDADTNASLDSGVVEATAIVARPGDKVSITRTDLDNIAGGVTKAVNSDNYFVTSIKYNDGRSLISGIDFNDEDDQLEVKFAKNFTNTKAKDWEVEFTLKGKGRNKPDQVKFKLIGTVGNILVDKNNQVEDIEITSADDAIKIGGKDGNFDPADKTVYKFWSDSKDKYATMELTASDEDVEVTVRVYDGDKLYLYNDQDADDAVLKKYADTDADLTFLNFPGTPTFNATATVRFYKEEGTYIYQNKGDGVLTPVTVASAGAAGQTVGNVKWDDDEGCYVLKTRTLGNYVFSDKKLAVSTSAGDAATTNPDTGANDVVGIASALAAVALVSAAAVSLKK